MARFASIHSDSGMLEEERTSFICMASKARLLISQPLLHHARTRAHAPGGRWRAVRVVAVRACHHSLIHTMLEGHVELSAYLRVAIVAKGGLLLRQEKLRCCRPVDGVTV